MEANPKKIQLTNDEKAKENKKEFFLATNVDITVESISKESIYFSYQLTHPNVNQKIFWTVNEIETALTMEEVMQGKGICPDEVLQIDAEKHSRLTK